jgi:hypothetical protein
MLQTSKRTDYAGNTPQRTCNLTRATCRTVIKIILSSIRSMTGNRMFSLKIISNSKDGLVFFAKPSQSQMKNMPFWITSGETTLTILW